MQSLSAMLSHLRHAYSLSRFRFFGTTWTAAGLAPPGESPGKNTGMGCHALPQGIFPSRDRTQVSRIAGGLFTSWTTPEALHGGGRTLHFIG